MTMSARDVDLEFERAYQRLFAGSTPTDTEASGAVGGSGIKSEPRADALKAFHTPDDGLRSASAVPSTSRIDRPRPSRSIDAGLLSLSRQASASKARPQAVEQDRSAQVQPIDRPRHAQPRSLHSPLDAFARHKTASSSKGKERAYDIPAEEAPKAPKPKRSVTTQDPAPPQSTSMTFPSPLAYYPYPAGQPPYQVPGQVVAPSPSMATLPGQAIAWTQPIMSAGPMPAIAYPGFSASVTFSQPQFFASPPQQVQSAVTALPTDVWPHQYTPQPQHGNSAASLHEQQEQNRYVTAPSGSRQQLRASLSPRKKYDERNRALRRWNEEQAARFDNKMHIKHASREASVLNTLRYKAKEKQRQRQEQQLDRPQKAKALLRDGNGMPIPKKRGRPPRIRDLTTLQGDVSGFDATASTTRIKTEAADAPPLHIDAFCPGSDLDLPLPAARGCPFDMETHTLFVHSARRLRWLARLAISQTDQRTNFYARAERSAAERIEWARWSTSIAARVHKQQDQTVLQVDAPAISDDGSASQSQPDSAGLFPRDRRKEYVALRKELHTANRVASTRIRAPTLVRYLAQTSTKAQQLKSNRKRREYLDRKHRAAKLAKYMLKSVRPAALDVRRMWGFWARAAHARNAGPAAQQQRRRAVSFAATPALEELPQQAADVGPRIKLEPESPSAQRTWLISASRDASHTAQVKQEASSDGIVTPALPSTPVLAAEDAPTVVDPAGAGAVSSALHARASASSGSRSVSPLFLRRNFRVYRLVGLSHLPLS